MPAKSKKQQRFFGMVRAQQKGKMKGASERVKKVAKDMKKSSVLHFASTKQEGLPETVGTLTFKKYLIESYKE